MPVYISLLRGINVSGQKKIRMADLRALYESLGFTPTQTLLQSGNVIFKSDSSDPAQLVNRIEAAIEAHFGFSVPIILRTPAEMQAVMERNPFSTEAEDDPIKQTVMFLADIPIAGAIDNLIQAYNGPEKIHSSGLELYLYYPDGQGRSKLTNAYIEKKLEVTGTIRNWNTIGKLIDMADTF